MKQISSLLKGCCIVLYVFILCCSTFIFPGEDVRAEFFMEELNNGVKLCQLIGVLQTKIAQSCPTAVCKVSQTATMKTARAIVQRADFMLAYGQSLGGTVWTHL